MRQIQIRKTVRKPREDKIVNPVPRTLSEMIKEDQS